MEQTVRGENESQEETDQKLDPIPDRLKKFSSPDELRQHGWTGVQGLPLNGLDFLVETEIVYLRGNPDEPSEIFLYGYKEHQQLVFGEIEYPWCMVLCPGNRTFDMTGIRRGQTVMKFHRPFRWESGCCGCCCCCCLQIYVPDTIQAIGWIQFGDCPLTESRMQVAMMQYPKDLDVGLKATVIACAMLIKYIFYDEMSIHYWIGCVLICPAMCKVLSRHHHHY
ncbi:uncharacterized protein LOC135396044 isoform X3 [Ornithodoros turicata]|uniref:uncharacterized protein LOC135396044 isoform X3 n=1 Tax=Ornithodoros turicata TaxID=34597 RepID=UPI0031393F05